MFAATVAAGTFAVLESIRDRELVFAEFSEKNGDREDEGAAEFGSRGVDRVWSADRCDGNLHTGIARGTLDGESMAAAADVCGTDRGGAGRICGVIDGNEWTSGSEEGSFDRDVNSLNTRLAKQKYVAPYYFAEIHARLGEEDRAMEYLEKSYEEHSHWLIYLHIGPSMDGLRSNRRFQKLLRSVGLPLGS